MPDLTPPALPGADILLVDDRPSNLLALEAVLDGLGDRFVRAASGEEALRLLADRDFAVVLLDVQMPGLSGFETAKQFRALDRSRHTPVIFLSAAESDEFPMAEAYRLGAVDYLLKPFVPDVLRAKVAVFVELFRRGERVRELERREGEERLRVALDAGQTGVWEWDIGTGRITWSDRVAGFYGMAPGEFDGTFEMFARHLHPDDAGRAREAIRACVERDEPYRIEYRIVRKDGDVRWIYTTGGVVRDPAGRPVRMHGATIDVTDRRKAEESLRESEGRYRALFTSIDEGFCVVEVLFDEADRPVDYRFLEVNPAFERHTGLHDATGRTMRELVPAHEAHWYEAYGRVVRTGEPVRFENEAKALGRWFDVYAFRLGGPESRKVAVLFTDMTERKRAEAALRASEERLRRMLSIDVVGVLVFEASTGTLLDANDAFLRSSGYARDEVAARALTWRTMTPPEHVAVSERQMEGFAATGRIGPYEKEYFRKDGSRSWMVFAGAALGDGTVVEYCIDVSDRKRAEEALRDAARRKDEFMAMLAHELRNPLAPLRNALQILDLRGGDPTVLGRVRGMMDRQVTHLSRLVDDLLDVSRITTGKVKLRPERLDLGRIVRQAAADNQAAFEAKRVTLRAGVPAGAVWVTGDHTRLAQVLDNLLTNALKFTAEGGEVGVAVAGDGGRTVLSVRDTGAGIESDMLTRLFEPFSQADRTLDRSAGGLGLGLAIVKGLVELHAGTIRADSAGLGEGSTFTVTLPAYVEPPALSASPPVAKPAGRRLRVLVVEDNQDTADSLRMLLEAYGYEVEVAYTGPDGVRTASEYRPEVVICDIGLPGLDGYGVATALRENPVTASSRLIALSGYGQDEDRRKARAAGFDEHLTKPADPAALELLLSAVS